MGYELQVTQKAKDYISEKGFDPQFGARPLNRAIQKHLEDPLAEEILQGDLKEGDVIVADFPASKEEITFKVKKKKKKEEPKKEQN